MGAYDQRLGEKWWIDLFFWVVVAPTLAQGAYAAYRCYSIARYFYCRFFRKKSWAEMPAGMPEANYPMVTVQICCYNEFTVIKRTIDAAASINWPPDRFEVMVCDDSTDETRGLVDDTAAEWCERGISVRVFRRGADRTGYKAGMLHAASEAVSGDFILMFDADHIADPEILRRGMGHFFTADGSQDRQIGLVQFPWAYYNLGTNILTECDGLMLDVAFVMEQKCRGQRLEFFGFNGTGGVWRKEAIDAGGGWSWDTITEDLDLSYKAHINGGYKFIFREDTPCALELPASVAAYKGQKRRWSKGFAQVTVKSFMSLMRKRKASLELKIECFFHLTGCMQYVLALWGLLWWPVLRYLDMTPVWLPWIFLSPLPPFLVSVCITVFAKASFGKYTTFRQRLLRLRFFPAAVVLACGMALNEGSAFIDGLFSKDATFVRTPKEGKADPNGSDGGSADTNGSGDRDDDDDDDEEKEEDEQLCDTEAGSPDGSVFNDAAAARAPMSTVAPVAAPVATLATPKASAHAAPMATVMTAAEVEAAEKTETAAAGTAPAQTAPATNASSGKRRKKPRYKAPKSVTWIGELALAAYFVAVFVLFLTDFIEGGQMSQLGKILSTGYLLPGIGFFVVGIHEPLSWFTLWRKRRAARRRAAAVAAAAAAAAAEAGFRGGAATSSRRMWRRRRPAVPVYPTAAEPEASTSEPPKKRTSPFGGRRDGGGSGRRAAAPVHPTSAEPASATSPTAGPLSGLGSKRGGGSRRSVAPVHPTAEEEPDASSETQTGSSPFGGSGRGGSRRTSPSARPEAEIP